MGAMMKMPVFGAGLIAREGSSRSGRGCELRAGRNGPVQGVAAGVGGDERSPEEPAIYQRAGVRPMITHDLQPRESPDGRADDDVAGPVAAGASCAPPPPLRPRPPQPPRAA